ncbi:zinc ribbon domain-containing protein [Haloquadratum walsbyi]|uniref:Transposase n=1 Tax=Haloquadratum walsbyi J07HQW2 TaxID=1238425 RepID=U1PQA7_9EURY|nr:MAG: transposase [Haloquadratum walsbyi J07HQW2]
MKVPPEETTKRCAKCGGESDKLLWVQEHSCPSCDYETNRDQNVSIEAQRLGLEELGVGFECRAGTVRIRTSVGDWNI